MKKLDLITIGRSSVDLYGSQVGGRLEDMASFAKYIGGSPTNIAAGAARLGLNSAVITRVGDEHMGRFIREQLVREGVDVRGVKTDPERLTALVLLGIRDQNQFPLIFYRENCADMALSEDDIDPAFIHAAEERIKSFFGDYADWVERHIRSMVDSRNALAVGEGDASTHIANVNAIAHELRGQSGIFDYPLITHIAKSLYDATISQAIEVTPAWIELIGAHIDTIRAVFSQKISGTGGEVGQALLQEMEIAVKKFAGQAAKKP